MIKTFVYDKQLCLFCSRIEEQGTNIGDNGHLEWIEQKTVVKRYLYT